MKVAGPRCFCPLPSAFSDATSVAECEEHTLFGETLHSSAPEFRLGRLARKAFRGGNDTTPPLLSGQCRARGPTCPRRCEPDSHCANFGVNILDWLRRGIVLGNPSGASLRSASPSPQDPAEAVPGARTTHGARLDTQHT